MRIESTKHIAKDLSDLTSKLEVNLESQGAGGVRAPTNAGPLAMSLATCIAQGNVKALVAPTIYLGASPKQPAIDPGTAGLGITSQSQPVLVMISDHAG